MTEKPARPDHPVFHGRRKGRPLRAGRRALLEKRLPALAIADDATTIDLERLFGRHCAGHEIEIGFGGGEHLVAQAKARPEHGFIGCEAYVNGVARLVAEIEADTLENIRIWPEDARRLLPRLPPAAFVRAYLLFPDPWPKTRHAKRRFIEPGNLSEIARIMTDDGEFRVASDDMGYIRWTLRHVRAHPDFQWPARGPADWRDRPADWPPTRYERKASGQGRRPVYLRFRRRPRAA